jgi:hypothetical protein
MIECTRAEIEEWLQYKETQWFLERVKEERKWVTDRIANGETLAGSQTPELTGRAVGTIDGLNYIINKDFLSDD